MKNKQHYRILFTQLKKLITDLQFQGILYPEKYKQNVKKFFDNCEIGHSKNKKCINPDCKSNMFILSFDIVKGIGLQNFNQIKYKKE